MRTARRLLAAGGADAALVDKARVYLGVALGNAALGAYVRAVDEDLPALLAWKNARSPLDKPLVEEEPLEDEEEFDDDEEGDYEEGVDLGELDGEGEDTAEEEE